MTQNSSITLSGQSPNFQEAENEVLYVKSPTLKCWRQLVTAWALETWIANFQSLDHKTPFKYMLMRNSHNSGGEVCRSRLEAQSGKVTCLRPPSQKGCEYMLGGSPGPRACVNPQLLSWEGIGALLREQGANSPSPWAKPLTGFVSSPLSRMRLGLETGLEVQWGLWPSLVLVTSQSPSHA